MAVKQQPTVSVTRWSGGQHPSMSKITDIMKTEHLRPYMWTNQANFRYGVRSHGYTKVLYVINGMAELTLPDSNQRVRLRSGDRVDIPAGVRHGMIVGNSGVTCVEAAVRRQRRHRQN